MDIEAVAAFDAGAVEPRDGVSTPQEDEVRTTSNPAFRNLPTTGAAILVCNPVTYLDWLYLIVLLPRQTTLLIPTPGYGKGTWAH